jgi:DNA-binding CsgD family transcriptional regulator
MPGEKDMALQFESTARGIQAAPAGLIDIDVAAPAPSFTRGAPRVSTQEMVIGVTLLDALDRVGYGGLVLDGRGDVISVNANGRRLLEQKLGRGAGSDADWLRRAARRLQDGITPWFPHNKEVWATIPCAGDRPLALHRIPLDAASGEDAHVVMILADFGAVPQPNPATLRRIFGLTGAEAKLAVQIGRGDTLASIARENNVRVATVRSQLAAVFGKTQTRRQTELAMLLARMAILP